LPFREREGGREDFLHTLILTRDLGFWNKIAEVEIQANDLIFWVEIHLQQNE
jgi:hypothetical protein